MQIIFSVAVRNILSAEQALAKKMHVFKGMTIWAPIYPPLECDCMDQTKAK